jgi:hypothetical protein
MRYAALVALATLVAGCSPTLTGEDRTAPVLAHVAGIDRHDAFAVNEVPCHKYLLDNGVHCIKP